MKSGSRFLTLACVIAFVVIFFGGVAIAADPETDVSTFQTEPTAAPAWEGSAPYGRNIFWNFSSNPFTSIDQAYYGFSDAALKSGDSVSWSSGTGATGYDAGGGGKIGVKGTNQSGTATFYINNFIESWDHKYFYVEYETEIKNGTITPSLTANSVIVASGWTNTSGNWVNQWYKIEPFPSSETFTLTFITGAGGGDKAWIKNLHIAATPEPISSALFLVGGMAMAAIQYRKRRKA